ncbi:MAG TPA: DMT family transporter, partial [Bacteroidales bacterium]|nr:DMT family transporter [Bacteroidales bacterium]
VYWFSAGLIWNLILSFFVPGTYSKFEIKGSYIIFLAIVGILDMTATILWFEAVDKTDNPSLVSFMTNISPVYAVILGYVFLKEKLSLSEGIGILVTLAGALLIGYRSDFTLSRFLFSGAGIILISSLISQGGKVILKTRIKNYHPIVLSMNRVVFLLGFSVLFVFIYDYSLEIGLDTILYIALGALMGPVISAFAGYNALARLKVSTWSILSTSRSFFVMLVSYLILHNLPDTIQIAGGLLTVAGVVVISLARVK